MGEGMLVRRGGIEKDDGKVLFYDNGYENPPITGGWVESNYLEGNGSLTKEETYLFLQVFNNNMTMGERGYVTDNTISLANISTLYVDWEQNAVGTHPDYSLSYLVVSSNKAGSGTNYEARKYEQGSFTRKTSSLDVSTLNGSYYIRVHARDTTGNADCPLDLKVYKVWGEV